MEINSPDDFREQPVIDIEVEFVGGAQNAWTINDEPDNPVNEREREIYFRFLKTLVTVERRNILWWGLTRRIDRIPLKKEGALSTAPQQPEGGMAGNSQK